MQHEFRSFSLENAIAQAVGRDRVNPKYISYKSWSNNKLVRHFYFGRGRGVTLSEMGLLDAVQNEANRLAINRMGGFKNQIRREVIRVRNGLVYENFNNSYSFGDVRFAMGGGRLSGEFVGRCAPKRNGAIEFSGDMIIEYSDKFIDPFSIIESLYGSSESSRAPKWLRNLADIGGTPYRVTGSWSEPFSGNIQLA